MFNRFFTSLIVAIAFSLIFSSCGGSGVKMAGITESQIEADPALMQLKKANQQMQDMFCSQREVLVKG